MSDSFPVQSPEHLSIRRIAPDERAREDLLLRKLGPKGWGRVHHFRNYYGSGWGENGRALSPKALDAFFRFVEDAQFPTAGPSVFLTDRGGIELCWEDRNGKSLSLSAALRFARVWYIEKDDPGSDP